MSHQKPPEPPARTPQPSLASKLDQLIDSSLSDKPVSSDPEEREALLIPPDARQYVRPAPRWDINEGKQAQEGKRVAEDNHIETATHVSPPVLAAVIVLGMLLGATAAAAVFHERLTPLIAQWQTERR